ncbi:uncharacterized protein LOC116010505 isoform X2 [Ipomoea triloba]|uniref:uncharacterized protein LOC116010505 isoform X2 n=1 Tax=Ipomoea triloba TaxID=35885 RepID=UPI00125E76F1|nr:uncharacterized protein LOC116010505 isoform X2 [Ipomoea triloba]
MGNRKSSDWSSSIAILGRRVLMEKREAIGGRRNGKRRRQGPQLQRQNRISGRDLLLLLLLIVLSVECQLCLNSLELLLGQLNFEHELLYLGHTSINWVFGTGVSLVNYRLHGDASLARINLLKYFDYIAYPKQPVCILKHVRLISWEIGCQRAVNFAPPPLVLARGTGLAGATLPSHRCKASNQQTEDAFAIFKSWPKLSKFVSLKKKNKTKQNKKQRVRGH